MSAKTVMMISLAVLAAAVLFMVVLSADSDSAESDDMSVTAYGEESADVMDGYMFDGPDPFGKSGPHGVPPVPEPIGPGQVPFDPNMPVIRSDRDGGRNVEIVVPDYTDSVPNGRIIDDFEYIYKEKKELESMGKTVKVLDDNEYGDVQADMVGVMMQMVDGVSAVAENGFLPSLLDRLEENGMKEAAKAVRDVLAYRSLYGEVIAEVQSPGLKSRGESAENEDDMNSVPYYLEEVTDDEEAPEVPDAPVLDEVVDTSSTTADGFFFRLVDRGCKAVI